MKVKSIMNKVFITDPDITLKKAAKIMSDKDIGSLVLVKRKNVVGILTERDIIKNVSKINKKVSTVMTKDLVFTNVNEKIENAAKIMANNKIKRILVMEKEKLVGIVTATDLVAHTDILNEDLIL